jgi:phage/plasmid-associated DNA primase
MAVTATDITREHYQRPEVKEIIAKFAMPDNCMRALNGDFHRWYAYSQDGNARLLNIKDDYDMITDTYRVLYQTLNVFDPGLMVVSRKREEITSEEPLGTPADTAAYTLGCDIDKGHGCNIEDPEVKQAVEEAAQFLADDLKKAGVHKSVWVLFSGGGIYVEIYHELCRPKTIEGRAAFFEMATDRFNAYLAHISNEFFKAHPEHTGKVKFDALNNSKRIFKSILSIHKKRPYAVTPLNRDAIKIDFDRARIPLSIEMIEEAGRWYSSYDIAEREPFLKLLDQFRETEGERPSKHFDEIRRSPYTVEKSDFPPCMKHIVETENNGEGKTRFTAVLSAYLYQVGWEEEEAWDLVKAVSDHNGLDNAAHIFDSCYGRICCPSCKTIQTDASGYPHLGLKGLGVCKPVPDMCDKWPGDYGIDAFFRKIGNRQQEPKIGKIPKLEDLTKAIGRKKRINSLTGEPEPDPITGEEEEPKLTLSPSKAATAVMNYMPLRISAMDTKETPKLWRYDSGIWQPDGERQVKNLIDGIAGDLSYERGLQETLRRLRGLSDTATFNGNPCLFPALDGVVDLSSGTFRAATPDDYLTFRCGAEFNNPVADYRLFLWFLCSSLPDPRDVLTALDIITAIAIRVPFEVIVLLFGGGSNGKGILEKVILALFTMARATAIKLEEMKRSRFGPGALLNKDVWIVTEVESVKDAMSVLKAESTGEMIDVDVKYGERVQGMPHAIPILDANNPIDFNDNSYGRKRRVIKLDFPYTFGDADGMRPIDRRLEEKLKRHEILSGIAQIVAARAPELVRTRRIYRRKSTEEQEDELKRQQFHLATFFDDCVSTTWPFTREDPEGDTPKKLKADEAYAAYIEYCKLFNVTVPAEKVPFGRYIAERYGVQSTHTSTTEGGKKIDYRYYPGIYLIKSATAARGDSKLSFYDRYDTPTTDIRQIWIVESDSCRGNTTDTTDKMISEVLSEIEEMFKFISSCKNERDITYENYLNRSVVSVVEAQKIPVFDTTDKENSVVDPEKSVVEEKPNSIEADLRRAEAERQEKEAHFSEVAERYTTRGAAQPGDSSEAPEAVTIRFKADYKTDLPGRPYELVKEGTIVEVPPKRAEHYISKGVAEAVTA